MKFCQNCKNKLGKKVHFNKKYCASCTKYLRKNPAHNLSEAQQKEALRLAGSMYRHDIAKKIKCSRTSLDRFAKINKNVNWNFLKYSAKTVDIVTEYYIKNGMSKTKKKFADLSVRSIIDRYLKDVNPRQKRWTNSEILEALKMAGLVSYGAQAVFFKRPRANSGSIKSLWVKRLKLKAHRVNGIHYNIAKHYVERSCPAYPCRIGDHGQIQWKILWVDFDKHLKNDLPDHLKSAIRALAKFQIWLHGKDAKTNIENMIMERT